MAISPTGDRNWAAIARRVTDSAYWGRVNGAAKAPLALNNETIDAVNAAGTGVVGLIKANASDIPVLGDSAIIGTPSTATGGIVTIDGTQTLTGKTLTGNIIADSVRCTTQFDAVTGTTGATLTNVVGMVVTVVPGVYRFYLDVPCVATANTGIKMAFKYTTTVMTSIQATARAFTASGVAVTKTTTTTDQALLLDSTAGVVISGVVEGTMVVGTGGTIQFQAAQHTAHADTVSVLVGASMTLTRLS